MGYGVVPCRVVLWCVVVVVCGHVVCVAVLVGVLLCHVVVGGGMQCAVVIRVFQWCIGSRGCATFCEVLW